MRLKAPVYIPLAGLKDFGRLVCALERAPMPSFALTVGGKQVLAAQLDIMNGRPVIYFTEAEVGGSQYLAYRVSNGVEEVTLADSVGNPTFVYSPILNVEKFPPALAKFGKVEKGAGYTAIKLKDMASLAKVAAYKTIYEEAPLPLFLAKQQRGGKATAATTIIGTIMSVNENDSLSYFYYVPLTSEPAEPFLRYASQRPEQPAFCSSLDEHGYIYLKVIRLAADHPLVKAYD
ncbi:hypothetical protein [Nitrososphaera viennensis]|uniref:Uncharacterized protein n=2 Tax=Nitrososphaera viennensis TaxID=1034015 RepID=A0A060HS38_9ARCH|nr:hypothetical protein [Nitrososphaera viennensis]AIC15967.1 hypothetical protein NVIE_017090 [Nitrososphaera viennensis EN76]UVS67943.1 hypothetical protein NWT39_08505 [Nitrososphaera viennensis]